MRKRDLRAYFGSLVHESAQDNPLKASRHQSFITSHLLGGLLALVVFPLYLASIGQPSILSAVAFVWLISPIFVAVFLSRTGRLSLAHLMSATSLTGLIVFAAGLTGGVTSFLIAWIIVVPLEAALSADRRVVYAAFGIAGAALLGLAASGLYGLLPQPLSFSHQPAVLALLGSMSALAYAGGLAVSIQGLYENSEREIRRGEERYRLLAENATDMITCHNANGRVLFASLASRQIVGEAAEALLGNGLFERVHVADRPAFLNAFSQSARTCQPVSVEFRILRKPTSANDGKSHEAVYSWAEMRCRPVPLQEAETHSAELVPFEIVAVTRDITARKAQEAEILKARDAAESANLAKTHFLANMSHELRTPLNAIIGFSEILHRELYGRIGEERYREYAHLIHESGEHLLSVVNEILDMSKIEAGKFDIVVEHFDVHSLVKSCCETMRHQGGKKSIDVRMKVQPHLPELAADKRACKQILLNLLANAIKFTEEGGSVEVSATLSGNDIELAVKDNGIGIAADDIPKLGNPFVQAESSYDRNYEGAGLGLSVVKGLVGLHGGSFAIESELGKGTVVRVCLPIESAEDSSDATADTAAPGDGLPVALAAGA
ncbi:MAG: PAS domain-containing sensor histidine kinase [Hyphomicrobiaceae bacterium]|nr:PAS domain-containing sensor histidine kinase [Hyphomicrobiaceae bacterium]